MKLRITLIALLLAGIFGQSKAAKPTIEARKGDITKRKDDAIVNAANMYLKGGSGVCGAIFKAAGWRRLQEACKEHKGTQGVRCPVGEARITDSFNLKELGVKYIIHAVGPDGRKIKDEDEQRKLLENAYTESLKLATKKKLTSISFPFISSGIYAIDPQLAARAAVHACTKYADSQATTLERIRFVLFSDADFKLFTTLLKGTHATK